MEVEKITVKVELGAWAVQAVAVLTDREAHTKEGAAGAAAALCRQLLAALQDTSDAGILVGAGVGQDGHQGPETINTKSSDPGGNLSVSSVYSLVPSAGTDMSDATPGGL